MVRINLVRAIGSQFCVSNADGLMIHGLIAKAFSENDHVELSFEGVTRLTTAFLNAAIGQLYDEHNDAQISSMLHIIDTDASQQNKIRNTVENAKVFFLNQLKKSSLTQASELGSE